MDNIKQFVSIYLSDGYIFPAFQLSLLVMLIYAVLNDLRGQLRHKGIYFPFKVPSTRATLTVERGEESWSHFNAVYGVLSAILILITDAISAWPNHKTIISLLNLGGLLYLNYFNVWFRNKIIGIVGRARYLNERM